jgi:hypothetical protein
VNNGALDYSCDAGPFLSVKNVSESIDQLIIDYIPELHPISPSEDKLINVGCGMHHNVKVAIKLLSLNDLSCLNVENDEFTILSKGKDEIGG